MKRITRWTSLRKAALLHKIETGEIEESCACREYGISEEELDSWRKHLSKFGLKGLRTTRLLDYRETANAI